MCADSNNGDARRAGRWQTWFWASLPLVLVLFLLALTFLPRWLEPSYGGKRVSQWFDEAVGLTSDEFHRSEAYQAFSEMEGDALPFLIRCLKVRLPSRPGPYSRFYAATPAKLRRFLPEPRSAAKVINRHYLALQVLSEIGADQRFKAAEGIPIKKASVASAIPVLRSLLESSDSGTRGFAAQAAAYMGPLAAPLVPELTELARWRDDAAPAVAQTLGPIVAVQALGTIGPAASNAVYVLIAMTTNTVPELRVPAIQSLGAMGAAARLAVPALASHLTNPGGFRFLAARALAEIGIVPDEVVPALLAMRQGTNSWEQYAAALALWNRDRQNPDLKADVIAVLRADPGPVMLSLGRMGTNAAVFLPEVRSFAEAPDPYVNKMAKRTLRLIQPVSARH
jgi:hypothetical protein